MRSILEMKLQEARHVCESAQGDLYQHQFAHWLMPQEFYYFANELETQTALIDQALGLIGITQTSLNRVEALTKTILKDGFHSPTMSLVHIPSNRAALAQGLTDIWGEDEGRMAEIEDILIEFNQSLRYMQRRRVDPINKLFMDLLRFPPITSFPDSLDLALVKDHFESVYHPQPSGHTIIEIPVQRLVKENRKS